MAQCFVLKSFSSVVYSVSYAVGGPTVGGSTTDVMLVQYLLNRYHKNYVQPYGGHRPLAVDGVMGAQTHYRLLHFLLVNFGAEGSSRAEPHFCLTYINPIENLHTGISPAEVMIASPMGRLTFNALLGVLPKPSFDASGKPSRLCLPDMPPLLLRDLERNIAVY